jgi:6-phosphofructokinase 1
VGAIDMVHRGDWGRMAALKSNEITSIPLTDALGQNKKVDDALITVALSLHDKLGGEKAEAHVITST